jgi:hypothetical protein
LRPAVLTHATPFANYSIKRSAHDERGRILCNHIGDVIEVVRLSALFRRATAM